MTNRQLAELFARAADQYKPPRSKAMRRASRLALSWPVEAAALWSQGESLQQLAGIGPSMSRQIKEWIQDPPEMLEPPPLRLHFLTMAEARSTLAPLDHWRALGDLQMHSVWSDGSDEIEDLASAARECGYAYIAITDHTKGLQIAGGIDEEKLARQGAEIAHLNERMDNFRVLRSAEVNLSPTGEVDMEPEALAQLDVVLGCFHSKLRLKEDQTERYIAALRNPNIQILGHPRGRVYNFRLGLQADWERVFAVAAELDKAVEIDCFPDRQDLDFQTLHLARQAGVRISLGTDAHAAWQLGYMDLGLAAAWKAGIPRDRILNFMNADELVSWANGLRGA